MSALLERYEVLLLDAYGVLITHDTVLPGAVRLIDHLNRSGRSFFIVTNDASRSPETSAARYARRGLQIPAGRIITSGLLLKPYFTQHNLAGARCLVLGTADSRAYVTGAGGQVIDPFGDTEPDVLVLCDEHGYPFLETIDRVLSLLYRKLDRGGAVHLVVPNPDLVYPAGPDRYGFTAGALSVLFESALAYRYPHRQDLSFVPLGKPHRPIFDEARRRAGDCTLVMVGDQPETDIRGAHRAGIASALVETGLGQPADRWPDPETRPTCILTTLDPSA